MAGIKIWYHEEIERTYKCVISGPVGTPFENGFFKVQLTQPDDYDPTPPKLWFKTKVYHPNIDKNGKEKFLASLA